MMKIGGVYILSRRSIARVLATITAALVMFCDVATAQAKDTVRRIHSAAISLHSLDLQMVGRTVSTIVPDFMYQEYKSLYLELKPSVAARSVIAPYQTAATKCGPPGAARSVIAPYQTDATQRRRNSRRGSGLKGKRTERMVEQLAEFTAWLRGNPINERDPATALDRK